MTASCGRSAPPAIALRNDIRVLRPGQSVPASTHGGRVLAGEPAALIEQIAELADCGVEHEAEDHRGYQRTPGHGHE
ncbi:MAG: hypothetical protein ACREKB_09705, partial [Candidatus Rokuibacteriota bacterium]